MKQFEYLLYIGLILGGFSLSCSHKLKQTESKASGNQLVQTFLLAQQTNQSEVALSIIRDSTAQNSLLFCELVRAANYITLYEYLISIGFILEIPSGNNYEYMALCQFQSHTIACLVKQINDLMINKELTKALIIAGLNLCDTVQRNIYVDKYVFTSIENAASEMHFISNLIKLNPQNQHYQNAMSTLIQRADRNTIVMFLKKVGFIQFNPRNDEYTEYNILKIDHLQNHFKKILIEKAEINQKVLKY